MTQPPAPKNPRPIRHDPKLGQLQVVVSWRVNAPHSMTVTEYRDAVESFLRSELPQPGPFSALYVTAYEISAPSEDEGRWDRPSALARTEDLDPDRPTRDIPGGDRL